MKYFPFSDEPYRLQMGVAPLDVSGWIERDERFVAEVNLRRDLLASERDTVLQVLPDAAAGIGELYDEFRGHLSALWPGDYVWQDGVFRVGATGREYPGVEDPHEQLAQMGEWVQEDLCLLGGSGPVTLTAGCVCFPSRWKLGDKIGRDPAAIHTPVPGYQAALARPTATFLERISPAKPVWRLNWTIHDSDHLYCPGPVPGRTDLTPENVLDVCFLRVERQTLRRLPESQAVVFTIRTYLTPLRDVLADSRRAGLLAATLRGLPEETAVYKGMGNCFSLLKQAMTHL
jgi:hypothetical protein